MRIIWDEVEFDEFFYPIPGTGDLPLNMWVDLDYWPLDGEATEFNITLGVEHFGASLPDNGRLASGRIDLRADGQPDFFVVLRVDSGMQDESPFFRDGKGANLGGNFYTWLENSSAIFDRALPDEGLMSSSSKQTFVALSGQDYSMYFGLDKDTNPGQPPIVQMIDADSPPTPILAFNAACTDVPQTGYVEDPIRFESIRIQFDGTGTCFDPHDIQDIIVFRDDKSPYFDFPDRNIGVFDFMNDMANWMAPGAAFDSATNPIEDSPILVNEWEIIPQPGNPDDFEVVLAPQYIMQFYPRDKIESAASIDDVADNFGPNSVGLPQNHVFSGSDYFIAVKTSTDIAYRDIIRATIPIGGVVASTGPTVLKSEEILDPEELGQTVRELTANVPVILEGLVPVNKTLGANETDMPIIGINTFTNLPCDGEEVYLEQLVVQFIEAASRYSPNLDLGENGDIVEYQDVNGDDTPLSGIKVWRRMGGNLYLVKFAETDHDPYTFLDNPSLVASSDAGNQAVLMVFNPGDPTVQDLLLVPENDEGDYAGNDFIITISTSEHFDMRQDNFSVAIISWGPDSPAAPKPDEVLNGETPVEYPSIPPAFQYASSSALKYYQKYQGTTRGIGFIDSEGVHSRSFKSINTNAINASTATRLNAVGNFTATLDDPQVEDRTHQVVLTWEDTNSDGAGTFNESGYWIESDMFGSFRALPHDPLPQDSERLFLNGPRFLVGRTVNFRIYAFQEGLNPSAKYPPMNGVGPIAETSITFDVSINPIPPTPDFNASPTQGCVPLVVQFRDESLDDPETWFWDFGDGSPISPQPDPIHTYWDWGTYLVTLTVCNEGGCATITSADLGIDIIVSDVPVADFEAEPTNVCVGDPIEFRAEEFTTGYPTYWEWDFGDAIGGTSNLPNPTYTYTAPGEYTVDLTVWNMCDAAGVYNIESKFEYITVTEGVVPDFIGDPTEGCGPLEVRFTDESLCDPDTWSWDFGDGSPPSPDQNPRHVFERGIYTICLTVTKDAIEATLCMDDYITVRGVLADFSIDPMEGCEPLEVQFTDESQCDPDSWSWDFGDGSLPSPEPNPLHEYSEPGPYTPCLTVTKDSFSDTHCSEVDITVNPEPTASFEFDVDCVLLQVSFTDTSTGDPDTWFWDFGDGHTSTERHPVHPYDNVGPFDVYLTVDNECPPESVAGPQLIDLRCPEISLDPTSLSLEVECGAEAPDDTFDVWNSAGGVLSYAITDDAIVSGNGIDWLECDPIIGESIGETDTIVVDYTASGLTPETYVATITVTDPSADNSPQTMAVDLTVLAMLAAVVEPAGTGTVVPDSGAYHYGDEITIEAFPNECWVFDHWEGSPIDGSTLNPVQMTMTACATSITAYLVEPIYTLTTNVSPPLSGFVIGGGTYDCGQVVTVTATPANDTWVFVQWEIDEDTDDPDNPIIISTDNPEHITMDANKSVTAVFVRTTYALTANASPPEGGSVEGAGVYTHGDTATVTAVPANILWEFGHWEGDDIDGSTNNPEQIFMDDNKYVTAVFHHLPDMLTTITLTFPPNGANLYGPPTFTWNVDGGGDNVYVVDFATYIAGNLIFRSSPIISGVRQWTMPESTWNQIPRGNLAFWRIRGADLDVSPLTIIYSDENPITPGPQPRWFKKN